MIRRVVFVFGLLPLALYGFLRWIATGEDATDMLVRFAKWGNAL